MADDPSWFRLLDRAERRAASIGIALRDSIVMRAHSPQTIAYLGYTTGANLGDAACMAAARSLFDDQQLVDWLRVHRFAPQSLRGGATAQAVMLGGGTLVGSSHFRSMLVESAASLDAPSFSLGMGLEDPETIAWGISSPQIMEQWIPALRSMVHLAVRGPRSQAILREAFGIEAAVSGDLALGLKAPVPSPREKLLGICLAAPQHMWGSTADRLFDATLATARALIGEGWTIRLFVLCPPEDRAITARLAAAINAGERVRVVVPRSPARFMEQVGACTALLGTRLHSIVMASMVDVPTVALAYRHKVEDFMASIDRSAWAIRTSEVDGAWLTDAALELSGDRNVHSTSVNRAVASLQGSLRRETSIARERLRLSAR